MSKRKFVVSAVAALSAGSMAFAGSADDWLSTTDDTAIIRSYGTRHVCVFTNTASAVTLTLKQAMTLEEYLVVGGGGSGGNAVGGGGGGGGVVHSGEPQGVAAAAQFEIAVGAGGEQRKDQKMSGLQGGHSTLSFGGQTIYGYGGGGGGGFREAVPAAAVQNQIGSGGGQGSTYSIGTEGWQWNAQQGHSGALSGNDSIGGGGGGAGSAGDWDCGGEGRWFSITGRAVAYGSGGGAGISSSIGFGGKGGTNAGNGGVSAASPATPGVDGTGGGGGSGGVGFTNLGGKGGSGAVVLVFSEAAATVSRFGILPIRDQLYVDSAVCPAPTVTNAEGAVLSPDADYSVSYVGNEGAGDAFAVVQGAENTPYAGYTAICPFRIHAVAYEDENILASDTNFYAKSVGQRMVYVFTNVGETVVFRTKRMLTRDNLLLVGGGGSGGSRFGGGGGGGGYVAQDEMALVEAGREGRLQVGAGAEVRPAQGTHGAAGRQGGHTWLDFGGESTVYAYGGGGGGSANSSTHLPASAAAAYNEIGSGGGDSSSTGESGWQWNAEQGHSGSAGRGSNTRGGGGGALLAAVRGGSGDGLHGGEGRTNDITGISVVYGSGGGGNMDATTPSHGGTNAGDGAATEGGGDGVDGTGGGGGGGISGNAILGGRGGSGIAVLSFLPGDQLNYRDEYILTPDKTVRRIDLPGRTVYVFTNVADEAVQVTALKRFKVRQALVVGGGGGGGKSIGGGGGGGGVVYSNRLSQVVEEASVLTVKVGGGGEGLSDKQDFSAGTQGGHSSLVVGGLSLVAYGGGGGAAYYKAPPAAAEEGEIGSGGGSSRAGIGTIGFQWQQGFAGGSASDMNNAAGGGGASETGQPGFKGGEGLAIGITGSNVVYGSGGGGGARYDTATTIGVPGVGGTNAGAGGNDGEGGHGVDGTGAGGGGGGRRIDAPAKDWIGGRGGCGTVILSVSPINGLMIILK